MNHRLCLIIAVSVATLACAVLITNASDSSDGETVKPVVDGVTYEIMDEDTARLLQFDENTYKKYYVDKGLTPPEVLEIPDTISVTDKETGETTEYRVTAIAEFGVCNTTLIKEVVVGDYVATIEPYNFDAMPNLTQVTFGSDVSEIGYSVFMDCPSLTSIDTTDSTLYFDGNGLYESRTYSLIRLLEYTSGRYSIISSASYLAKTACEGCSKLTEIVMTSALISIGSFSFENCTALEHITSIDSQGVETTDALPDNLVFIGEDAFYGCVKLNDFKMNEYLTIISDGAFEKCSSLTYVDLPWDVSFVGESAFSGCDSLQSININEANEKYATLDGVLYEKVYQNSYTTLICYPMGKTLSDGCFELPADVTGVAYKAFSGSGDLKKLVLNANLSYLDAGAFMDCTSLETVNIPEAITVLNTNLFLNCSSLKSITVESSIIRIEAGALSNCDALTDITLPETLKYIGEYAFCDCDALTYICIPKSVETVDECAFFKTGLTHLRVDGEKTVFKDGSLHVSTETARVLEIECSENLSIPDTAFNTNPEPPVVTPHYSYFDKVPYPYENWVAIAFCVALMVFIAVKLRRV